MSIPAGRPQFEVGWTYRCEQPVPLREQVELEPRPRWRWQPAAFPAGTVFRIERINMFGTYRLTFLDGGPPGDPNRPRTGDFELSNVPEGSCVAIGEPAPAPAECVEPVGPCFEVGKTYRCEAAVELLEVDRFFSNPSSRATLAAGGVFRIDSGTNVGFAITVLNGEPVGRGDTATGDYEIAAVEAARCVAVG